MLNKNEIIIGPYTLKEIKDRTNIFLNVPLNTQTLNNLVYLSKNNIINLNPTNKDMVDEERYLKDVITVINKLAQVNKNYTVSIKIYNRELLRQSNLITNLPKNVDLLVESDDYTYTLPEYKKDEQRIEALIARVRSADLSPFEKYIATYDIVKNFKPYNKSEKDERKNRQLRYILDENNEFIVCSGYAKLLTELLNRLGIPSMFIALNFEKKSENGFMGHARNIIKIDDDKYNIHGYYVADSTWDNNPNNRDLYMNSIMTFDRKKEANYRETLEDYDLLLDFHDADEFAKKMKYYIKKSISLPKIDAQNEEILRKRAYRELYLKIMHILSLMDKKMYKKIYDKYNDYIDIDLDNTTSNSLEPIMTQLFLDYAKYIIPLSNNNVEMNKVLTAAKTVKEKVYWMNDLEIKEWLEKVINDNNRVEEKYFPYKYDHNNKTESYLEDKPKKR